MDIDEHPSGLQLELDNQLAYLEAGGQQPNKMLSN